MKGEAKITVESALRGWVRVSIEMGRHTIAESWKMSEAEAIREAEEIAHRMGWKIA